MAIICTKEDTDIIIDEQSTLVVRFSVLNPDGSYRDLSSGSVTWVASFGGEQKIKKTTATMLVSLGLRTQTDTCAGPQIGATSFTVTKVEGFGGNYQDFSAGDWIQIANKQGTNNEIVQLESVDTVTKTLHLVTPLTKSYSACPNQSVTGAWVNRLVTNFEFTLLPGDTILPPTKSYGTPVVWEHMAKVEWAAPLTPGNPNKEPTTMVAGRGKLYIIPVFSTGV
jgi:hypothetical protein